MKFVWPKQHATDTLLGLNYLENMDIVYINQIKLGNKYEDMYCNLSPTILTQIYKKYECCEQWITCNLI